MLFRSGGICAEICPEEVAIRGIATSLISTQLPPSTEGGGSVSAVWAVAKLAPVIVMNEPGLKFALPSAEFTTPRVVFTRGELDAFAGVRGTTLRPAKVSA